MTKKVKKLLNKVSNSMKESVKKRIFQSKKKDWSIFAKTIEPMFNEIKDKIPPYKIKIYRNKKDIKKNIIRGTIIYPIPSYITIKFTV